MRRCLLLSLLISCFVPGLFGQNPDPDFNFSYALPKGNQGAILPDGTILFPDTIVNLSNASLSQTSSDTFVITNRSTTSKTVNNITINGGPFRLSGLPLLPVTLQANQSLTLTVDFQPAQLGAASGTLHLDLPTRGVNFTLSGNGVGSVLSYELTTNGTARTVTSTDTLTLPQTTLGDKTTVTMRVTNTGNSDAVISFLQSSDTLFALSNTPFLPITLQPGNSFTFNINFAPTQAGSFTARLKIGDVSFNMSAVGVGVTLTYTVVVGSASTTLAPGGTVIFTPTQVGSTSSATVQINNTGNTAAFINSISVSGPATDVFTLPNLPSLPLRINGGATASFVVAFAPITLGQTTGTLKVDNQTFTISAVGNAPPSLPRVTFNGAASAVDAAQQVAVGVTLDNPYPVQLAGKLTLTFAPNADVFSDDPAIAFASGGRTVNFIVPANSRNAVFGLSDSQIRFQTGTVAGTITLATTFATDAGGINLTVGGGPATNISVRSSAPRMTSVQLSNRTASTVSVLITGYSPTRSVNSMAFTFTPYVDPNNKDLKLETTGLTLPVDGPFGVWYRSTGSQAFGSLFTVTVNFNIAGNVDAIQSLSVTLSNGVGASNSGSVTLR